MGPSHRSSSRATQVRNKSEKTGVHAKTLLLYTKCCLRLYSAVRHAEYQVDIIDGQNTSEPHLDIQSYQKDTGAKIVSFRAAVGELVSLFPMKKTSVLF